VCTIGSHTQSVVTPPSLSAREDGDEGGDGGGVGGTLVGMVAMDHSLDVIVISMSIDAMVRRLGRLWEVVCGVVSA
jgi:hypothetical protein